MRYIKVTELGEFVSESIKQIINGVAKAKKDVKGGEVNPTTVGENLIRRTIEFDVNVAMSNETVANNIRFQIPVVFS